MLSITKDLKFLTLHFLTDDSRTRAHQSTCSIPMAEIQQVFAGKCLSPQIWTSTPVDDNIVTIIFGPSAEEQHTAAFRVDTIDESDTFVNCIKTMRLAMVRGQDE